MNHAQIANIPVNHTPSKERERKYHPLGNSLLQFQFPDFINPPSSLPKQSSKLKPLRKPMNPKTTSHHNTGAVPVTPVNATGVSGAGKMVMHNSFYWGHDAQVLFSGWPGSDSRMYAVAVVFVFVLSVFVEWLTYCNFMKPSAGKVSTVVLQTMVHAVRTGLSYMVMLAVMSFNGGIFLAAVGGHALGFFVFRAKRKSDGSGCSKRNGPPQMTC